MNSHTLEITTDPSPTEDATRLTEPARTSPTAKMPGNEVAKGEDAGRIASVLSRVVDIGQWKPSMVIAYDTDSPLGAGA